MAASLRTFSDPRTHPKTVIFCKRTELDCNVYQYLKVSLKSAYVTMYHASKSDETKEHVYASFVSGCLCVLVSTIAFGVVGFTCVLANYVHHSTIQTVEISSMNYVDTLYETSIQSPL